MRSNKIYIVFVFLILLAAGCKTPVATKSKATSTSKTFTDRQKVDFQNYFYDANREKMLGNYEKALNLFGQALHIDNNSAATIYEMARMFERLNKDKESLSFAKKATQLDPDNTWYLSFLAEILQKNNYKSEAANVYEQLVKKNPENTNYYFDWANALIQAGKLNEAAKAYDKLEEKIGIKQEISLQKERIYLKLNKIDKAVGELQKLINENPKDVQYLGILAELYQANNMMDKALETFKKILELDPDNAFVHLSLANYYRSTGDREKTFQELKAAFSNKNTDIETLINILSSYFGLIEKYPEMKDQAFSLCKLLIESHPNEAKSHAIYGDFLYLDKKLEEARDQYRQAINLDKEKYIIWQQVLLIDSELSDFNSMLKDTEEAMALFPNQPFVYLFNGMAKIQLKKYTEAIEVLNMGIKQVVDNKAMMSQFYSQLGDAYYKLKNNKESDKSFDKALEYDPKNMFVLNNYSYYLSLRGDSLNKAEQMSLLSNTLSPDNSSFQDTYGWILYKLGKYEDAKIWLAKAMKTGGSDSGVILEHYGDVLYRMKDLTGAMEYWNKAKTAGNASEFLDKKIADKKLYE